MRLREATEIEVETVRVSDEVNVDLGPDGAVYGIELLNAHSQFVAADNGQLVLEWGTQRLAVPLPETV